MTKEKLVVGQKQFYKLAEQVAQRREDLINKCHTIAEAMTYMATFVDFKFSDNAMKDALEVHEIKLERQKKASSSKNTVVSNARRTLTLQMMKLLEALGVEPTESFAQLAMMDIGKYPTTYKGTGAKSLSEVVKTTNISAVS